MKRCCCVYFIYFIDKPYVQGMNALAGGLLFVMPEIDAFHTFTILINKICPTYWISKKHANAKGGSALPGAHAGAVLVDVVLGIIDPKLREHILDAPVFHPSIYYFPAISSLLGCAPPFDELVRLWDFLFTFGVYNIVLCVVAHLINHRSKILETQSQDLLQSHVGQHWQKINSNQIISTTMNILPKVRSNEKVWKQIIYHMTSVSVCDDIKEETEKDYFQIASRASKKRNSQNAKSSKNPSSHRKVQSATSLVKTTMHNSLGTLTSGTVGPDGAMSPSGSLEQSNSVGSRRVSRARRRVSSAGAQL